MVALQPSYWQQITAGVVVIVPTLIVGAVLLGWLCRSVLVPRAAGRRWPEGARGVRPVVELLVDLQRRSGVTGADRRGWSQAGRFGLVVAACAVVPVSTGLVLTQPGLGLFAVAVALAADAGFEWIGVRSATGGGDRDGADSPAPHAATMLWTRIGLAALVGLATGVVAAQWGTAVMGRVVAAQADAAVGGNSLFGVPTFVVHPVVALVSVAALYATIVTMAQSAAIRDGGPTGVFAQVVNDAWVIGLAGWWVAAFAGGGAVPWTVANPGTRQVLAVAVFATKAVAATIALVWARATWPTISLRKVRGLLALGAAAATVTLAGTLLIRSLV